jgi:hypothetical protein
MESAFPVHSHPTIAVSQPRSAGRLLGIPLFVYASVFASLSIIVGLIWDISWHISIGRDGLLSPPHLAIYLGAVISGLFSGYQVLKTTFAGTAEEKSQSVRFWGVFYGSLGALFCIWGAFAMLTSAPFDDWWHNTYGLDVVILSPPHTVLLLGMMMVQFGAMMGTLALQNRDNTLSVLSQADDARRERMLKLLFVTAAGLVLSTLFTMVSEYLGRHNMHHSLFYQIGCGVFMFFLVAVARASKLKWAATATALVYMSILALMCWILPLFPAEPKLGPVLNHITRYQAFNFPLLLAVPALAIDWLMYKYRNKNAWLLSLMMAAAFLLLLLATQWPMGDFLMSPYARNIIFGADSWYFGNSPDWEYRYKFGPWNLQPATEFLIGLLIALALGTLSARIGLSWGNWMRRIQR